MAVSPRGSSVSDGAGSSWGCGTLVDGKGGCEIRTYASGIAVSKVLTMGDACSNFLEIMRWIICDVEPTHSGNMCKRTCWVCGRNQNHTHSHPLWHDDVPVPRARRFMFVH